MGPCINENTSSCADMDVTSRYGGYGCRCGSSVTTTTMTLVVVTSITPLREPLAK